MAPQKQLKKAPDPLIAKFKVAYWGETGSNEVLSKMFDSQAEAQTFLEGKNGLLFENQRAEGPEYTWIVVPTGSAYAAYKTASWMYKYRWWILGLILIVIGFFVYRHFKHKMFGDGGTVAPVAAPTPAPAPPPAPAPAPVSTGTEVPA